MCLNRSCISLAFWLFCFLIFRGVGASQQAPAAPDKLQSILDRLDQLERQNKELLDEIRELRETIKAQAPPAGAQDDRVDVMEQRTKELAQSKVGTSQRFPISLTGMFLFDASLIRGGDNAVFQQNYGDYGQGAPGGGATLRQSIIGLDFHGPSLFAGGRVLGSISMDFYSPYGDYNVFRLRRGSVSFDWAKRTLTFGQEKPLISPLEPTSYARVGIPPLSGSGNLWLWRPQMRYEERVALSENSQLKLQAALFSTAETYGTPNIPAGTYIESTRPGWEERVEYSRHWSDDARVAIGIGGHESISHIDGISIPSRVATADFLFRPAPWFELSGTLLHGENFSNLGGLPAGVTVTASRVIPIRGNAGWMQIAVPIGRITFNVYGGRQLNIGRDLTPYAISRSFTFAGNALYRIAPNVVLGFEGSHENLGYFNGSVFPANRYDATVAYLF